MMMLTKMLLLIYVQNGEHILGGPNTDVKTFGHMHLTNKY